MSYGCYALTPVIPDASVLGHDWRGLTAGCPLTVPKTLPLATKCLLWRDLAP